MQSLERRYFGRTYLADSLADRLVRLEQFVFGAQPKGDLNFRLAKLLKVLAPVKPSSSASSTSNTSGNSTANSSSTSSSNETGNAISDPATIATAANLAGTQNSSTNSAALQTNTNKNTEVAPGAPAQKSLLAVINEGIDNYNKRRFHNAEDDFNKAIEIAPGLSRTYAYLGVTLLQLNERASAIDALRVAYEIDPFGTFGRYAKNSLILLAGDEEIRRRGPKDDMKIVESTLSKVNKQSSSQQSLLSKSGSLIANARQITANRTAERMSSESHSPDPDQYSNERALSSSYGRTDSSVQMANARREAALRSAFTQESANNLKSLITSKVIHGGAKLRAFGTTLNTRYYGDETRNLAPWYIPREAPLEYKAQAKSLIKPRKQDSRQQVQKKQAVTKSRQRARRVQGKRSKGSTTMRRN